MKITSGDFFAGGGGVTVAMRKIPGMECRWILNHDPIAIKTNAFNNKKVKCYWADFYKQDEKQMEPVDFTWASVECTQHSKAGGNKPKKIGSYMLGWELLRYIRHLNSYVIGIENVPEFKDWAPIKLLKDEENSTENYTALQVDENGHYMMQVLWERKGEEFQKWKKAIEDLGYVYSEKILNAADFGIPTRRVRFFCFFVKKELNMEIPWAAPTHDKYGKNGLKKWVACKKYIDLNKEGNSIFGREFNENVKKGHRHPLSPNTLTRIAGGIKKFNPEMYSLLQYYTKGNVLSSTDKDALVSKLKMEKLNFIAEFISDGTFSTEGKNVSLNEPCSTLTSQQRHQKIKAFMSVQNNSNGNPAANNFSLEEPLWATTVTEKFQFISSHFNSSGHPETQNQSIDFPLGTILTEPNKKSLITAIQNGLIDFDIKMRFLEPDEIARISTFPDGYFSNPELKLSKKAITKLVGNAVPPEWAKIIIQPVCKELKRLLTNRRIAA